MAGEQFTDVHVASMVRMLMRDQLDHEAICIMARDRIMALAQERDRLRAELAEVTERAAAAETQIQDVIEKYGDPEDEQTLDQVVQWFVNSSNEGWNSAGDELAKRLEAEKRAEAALAELQQAAQAVVDRWDSPSWKDQPHTAEFINRLRHAIESARRAVDTAAKP